MNDYLMAVPSEVPGGIEARRSGHFGHCPVFTLVTLRNGEVVYTEVLDNPPHQAGGCLAPIERLKARGVDGIVVGGIGKRPLAVMQEAGITVLRAAVEDCPEVSDAVAAHLAGQLEAMRPEFVCTGHNCHTTDS